MSATAHATATPAVLADPHYLDPAAVPAVPTLRAVPAAAAPPADDPRVPGLAPGVWRCVEHLKPLLVGGAVLRIDPDRGGFILEASTGAELARASRTSELAALLDGMAGKIKPKGRVILAIGKLMPAVARVRFQGESLNALVKAAVAAEVQRRTAAFDAECAALDAGTLDAAEVA